MEVVVIQKVAIGVMDAIYNDTGKWMVINVANNGTVRFLDDDAVIEQLVMSVKMV